MKRLSALVGLLVSIGMLAAVPASAQDARVEAAKKEGKVVWYTSLALPTAEKIGKLFEAAYPGIKVEVQRTGSQRILQRVMQEMQANLKLVDVIHTSDAGHFVLLKEKKLLMKYTPAGVDAFPAGFKDKDGYYYALRATVNVIAYNTEARPRGRGAEGLEGPAGPEVAGQDGDGAPGLQRRDRRRTCWRSCSSTAGTTSSSSRRTSSMLVQSAVDPAGVVASGERQVAVDGGDYYYYQMKKKGNPIEVVYPKEGVPLVSLTERDRELRAAPERRQALHGLHLHPRDPAGDGRQRGALHRPSRGEVPDRQAEAVGSQAPDRRPGGAREAQRGDQEPVRRVLRRLEPAGERMRGVCSGLDRSLPGVGRCRCSRWSC